MNISAVIVAFLKITMHLLQIFHSDKPSNNDELSNLSLKLLISFCCAGSETQVFAQARQLLYL